MPSNLTLVQSVDRDLSVFPEGSVILDDTVQKGSFRVSALLITCLLTVITTFVSVLPVMVINAVNTGSLGADLLGDIVQQEFHTHYVSVQTALAEADYWMDFIDGWLRRTPVALNSSDLATSLKDVMLPWLTTVANRMGGMCVEVVVNREPFDKMSYCASKLDLFGPREVFWEHQEGTIMYKTKVDMDGNYLETVDSWPWLPEPRAPFFWPDGHREWLEPWLWKEGRPGGQRFFFTEMGQQRMVQTRGYTVLNHLFIQDLDWAKLLRLSLSQASRATNQSVAFLFCNSGIMMTSTCGRTHMNDSLFIANQSDCPIVSEIYNILQLGGHLENNSSFFRAMLAGMPYLVGMKRLISFKGDGTPYILAFAYPYSAIDEPLRWNLFLLVVATIIALFGVSSVACLLTYRLIAAPLRDLATDMDCCVQLKMASAVHHSATYISELLTIMNSFYKMKSTLHAISKFVPVFVVQRSLQYGHPIVVSMSPSMASILFLRVDNFANLAETIDTTILIQGVSTFFELLSDVIVEYHGWINYYVGDCVMALWNLPQETVDHEFLACSAALKCADTMKSSRLKTIYLKGCMGLESGCVHAGLFGSRHRMSYTVVGDIVNIASCMETLNKQCKSTILLGPQIHSAVASRVITQCWPDLEVKEGPSKLDAFELKSLAQCHSPQALLQ